MNILITSSIIDKGHTSLEFTMKDIVTASYFLHVEYKSLKTFASRRMGVVKKEVIKASLINTPIYADSKMIIWEDRIILNYPSEEIDARLLMLAYTIAVSADKVTAFSNAVRYIDATMHELKKKERAVNNALRIAFGEKFPNNFLDNFLDAEQLRKALRKTAKVYIYEDKVAVEYANIKIGTKEDGYLIYDKIILYLKGWLIDGYLFRFKNFDYNSYWGLNLPLHPSIAVPLCYNGSLDFHNSQDYESFAYLLTENVKNPAEGLITFGNLIKNFNLYRRIFDALKYKNTSREALSRSIFNQKI